MLFPVTTYRSVIVERRVRKYAKVTSHMLVASRALAHNRVFVDLHTVYAAAIIAAPSTILLDDFLLSMLTSRFNTLTVCRN